MSVSWSVIYPNNFCPTQTCSIELNWDPQILCSCGDSLLSVVESPVIHEEQVGRRRIAGIDVGGGDKLGPQLGQCRCGANLW